MLLILGGHMMKKLIEYIFIVAILFNLGSLIWFILGASAFFMRGLDLIMTVLLMYLGIPSLLLLTVSIVILFKKTLGNNRLFIIQCILIIALILFGYNLYKSVDEYGWFQTRTYSETIKTTDDSKYEYKIELVNMFQRNSYARLYMKNVKTEEISYISLDINTRDIGGFSMRQEVHWGELKYTEVEGQYLLYITEEFPFPMDRFFIDMNKNTSETLD